MGMHRSHVLEPTLISQVKPAMSKMKPRKAIYNPDFIAANQAARADNVLSGTPAEQVEAIRQDIRDFKAKAGLDKVVVLWTANTERFAEIQYGLNDTAANLMAAIERGESEISDRQCADFRAAYFDTSFEVARSVLSCVCSRRHRACRLDSRLASAFGF